MNITVQRLQSPARGSLAEHFLALPSEDRRLRFGSPLHSESITGYVDAIDFDRDAVFGVHDDHLVLVGVAHVAFGEDLAELGLSVLPRHRGHGVGTALFERASTHARNRFTPTLFMHCLSENAPVMRIARRFGMKIVTGFGDADAHLELPPASPSSITEELLTDGFALCDHAIKAHSAAWKRISATLLGEAPAQRERVG